MSPHDEVILAAAAALERESGPLAVGAAEAIQNGVPELPASLAVTSQSTAAVRELIAVVARSLLRGTDPDDVIVPEETLEHARMYVRRGVDLPFLMRTYRVGHAVMWRIWTSMLDAQAADDATRVLLRDRTGDLFFRYIDAVSTKVAAEYLAERERWSRSAAAQRISMVRDVLDGQPIDSDTASRVLGAELRRTHLAFVVWATAGQDATGAPQRLQRAGEEFAAGHGDRRPLLVPVGHRVLWGWCSPVVSGPDRVAGRPDAQTPDAHTQDEEFFGHEKDRTNGIISFETSAQSQRVNSAQTPFRGKVGRPPAQIGTPSARVGAEAESALGDGVNVAVGEAAYGIDGFRMSHRQALAARRVALLADRPASGVVAWGDVAVLGLLSADLDLGRDFVRRELGDLGVDGDVAIRLRETLTVFLDEGEHVGRTAARLAVHANTVANRLRRCEQAVGRPLHERRAELRAALTLRDGMRVDAG